MNKAVTNKRQGWEEHCPDSPLVTSAACKTNSTMLYTHMSCISLGFGSVVQVVHVSPDMRKAYIGSSSDLTANGKSIMAFNKSWRSLPIQSWSGGLKIAGLPSLTAMTCVSTIPLGEGERGCM